MIRFNLNSNRALYTLVVYGCISLAISSCVDNNYDLSGTLDKDISVGGSIALPIGSTENITLESMLDGVDSDLLANIDGNYKLFMKDSINETIKLDDGGIVIDGVSNEDKLFINFNKPAGLPVRSAAVPNLPLDDIITDLGEITQQVDILTSVPKEISRIDSVDFGGKSVEATVEFNITDLASLDLDLSLSNYVIEFPRFFVFDEESNVVNNKLVINEKLVKDNGVFSVKKVLKIKKLVFTDDEYKDIISVSGDNKSLSINSQIYLSGDLKLSTDGINISDIPDSALGSIKVNFDNIEVNNVYGVIDTNIDIEPKKIDLSDLTKEFDGDISIVLADPSITIEAKNSISVPLQISQLVLQPVKDDVNLEKIYVDETIDIRPATEGEDVTTKIIISANDVTSTEDGVKYVKLNNFMNLLKEMPDYILVDIEAGVKPVAIGVNHMIDLSKSEYELGIKYNLDIPLSFDELSLDFSTKIEDLGGDLSELFDYVSKLELVLDVANTLPISLEIDKITPIDKDGNEITTLPSFINEGENTINAESTSSIVKATIEDKDGAIEELDGLDIRIKANITKVEGGNELKADQYIKLKITAKVPEGLNINLDEQE